MSQDLNRLTANFSNLLPVQSQRWEAIAHPPVWAALPQALAVRLPLTLSQGLALAAPATRVPGWLAFAQLAQGLIWRQPFIPEPGDQPSLPETRSNPINWLGLGAVISTGITTLADRMVTSLGQVPGSLLAGQRRQIQKPSAQVIALAEQTPLREMSLLPTMNLSLPVLPGTSGSREGFSILSDRSPQSQAVVTISPPLAVSLSIPRLLPGPKYNQPTLLQPPVQGAQGSLPISVMASTVYTTLATQLKPWPLPSLANQLGPQSPPDLVRNLGGDAQPLPLFQVASQSLPTPGPTLAELPRRATAQPLPTSQPLPAPEPAATVTPFTFNGGIHVQIAATTIDRDHAEETARMIAAHVLTEINRITDRDRFRRGLPPRPNR
jgi:hypothetical protein